MQHSFERLWSTLHTPRLCISDKEQLILVQIDPRKSFAAPRLLQIFTVGPVGFFQSSVVGNIFSQRHSPVHRHIQLFELEIVVLINHALAPLDILPTRRLGPPFAHISNLVEITTRIIETVSNLVADYCTHSAIIQSFRESTIEHWSLEYSGGEH